MKRPLLKNLKRVMAGMAVLLLTVSCFGSSASDSGMGALPSWMPALSDPAIPSRTVSVADFGGRGDGAH